MRGVKVAQANSPNQTFLAQFGQFRQCIDIARVVKGPPMELQQVDAGGLQTVQRALHAFAHDGGAHGTWRWAPFGKGMHAWLRFGGQQRAGNDLGRAVVVRHVKGIKALRGIGRQVGCALHRVQQSPAALHVRHLPQAGDDARDFQARCQQRARWAQTAGARS